MKHLKNILAGMGDVLAALGTAPPYRYPSSNDRANDAKKIAGDWAHVGRDMKKAIDREGKERNGALLHDTAQR